MAIVASDSGGEHYGIQALDYATVDGIRQRFNALSPYRSVPDILKLEYRGMAFAISAKRYALYHMDGNRVIIDKNSEHGLGHLLNPTDPDAEDKQWITQVWRYIIATQLAAVNGEEPSWLDRPAISRYSVSQVSLLRTFDKINEGKPYSQRIKPANFILVGHAYPVQPTFIGRIVPIAPFERDASRWAIMQWINKHSPDQVFQVDTFGDAVTIKVGVAYVKSYRDVLALYEIHPEEKFDTPDGRPCTRDYRGILVRKHVRSIGLSYVGKESNQVEQVQLGLMSASEVTRRQDLHDWDAVFALVKPVIAGYSVSDLARALHVPRSTAGHILAGRTPSEKNQEAVLRLATAIAADDLGERRSPKEDPRIILARWKDTMPSRPATRITDTDQIPISSDHDISD
jgi:hypothetical protein